MKKDCLGFTLIEILVTIGVIALLSGIGLASYNQFNRKQILDQAAKTLKSDLRLAQSKALAGLKDCTVGVCGGTSGGCGNDGSEKSLDGWFVSFTDRLYTLYGSCGGGTTTFSTKTISLPTNVSFNPVPSAVRFQPLNQGVNLAQTLTLTAFGLSKTVTVSISGEIE